MLTVPGRHRYPRRSSRVSAVAAAVALALVVSGVSVGLRQMAVGGCSGGTPLTVAAAPEIAPAVQSAVTALAEDGNDGDGACLQVSVNAVNPVEVAAIVAAQHRVSLPGVGQANGATAAPDVWIPDSSTWLSRLTSAAPAFAPTDGASIARSPVVAAAPDPVVDRFGWSDQTPTWTGLLTRVAAGVGLNIGVVEPSRDAVGLSGLVALTSAGGSVAPEVTTGALRSLALSRSEVRDDLTARFPRATDPSTLATALGLAVMSEQHVIAFNATRPPVPLIPVHVQPAPVPLDYPFAVMPGVEPAVLSAADTLHRALDAQPFRDLLGPLGLRLPDGSEGRGFTAPTGTPGALPSGPPAVVSPAVIQRALSTWSAVVSPARMLAVIDVSGTMAGTVPTAGNATRMQVTLEAARRGLGLFNDDWAVGLWIFSTYLDGDRDYRQLVPIERLSTNRERLVDALGQIRPKRGGDTGLYDTILAAYQEVQADWQPGRVNSVVILTDGIGNDDADGVSLTELTDRLTELRDDTRPVQLIILGLGDKVHRTELEKVTKVTGGGVLVAEDPATIGDVFLRAIAMRPAAR